jgi:hypothetical protein
MALLSEGSPPIPLRPSRLAFNRLGSSSLCVGDHYCSLRRQVSPLSTTKFTFSILF